MIYAINNYKPFFDTKIDFRLSITHTYSSGLNKANFMETKNYPVLFKQSHY